MTPVTFLQRFALEYLLVALCCPGVLLLLLLRLGMRSVSRPPPCILGNGWWGGSHVSHPLREQRARVSKWKNDEERGGLGGCSGATLTRERYPRNGRITMWVRPPLFIFPSTASLTRRRTASSERAVADIRMPSIGSPGLISNRRQHPPAVEGHHDHSRRKAAVP